MATPSTPSHWPDSAKASLGFHKPQEGNGGGVELAFLDLNEKPVLQELFEIELDMLDVLLLLLGKDQYVVQVNKNELIKHVPEHIID